MKVVQNLSYGKNEGQKFDLYLPDDASGVRHAVIWFYGGGLVNGKKEDNAFLAEPLCERGVALCLPSYRLMPEAKYPEFIEDAAASVKAAKDALLERGIQASVTLGGSSAGAYLALMLCFDRRYLAAVGLSPDEIHAFFFNSGQPTAHFNVLKSRRIDERRIIIDDTSALFHVDETLPRRPMLILCAENDMPSRVTQNMLLKETILRFGMPESLLEMEVLPGFRHCGHDRQKQENGEYYLFSRLMKLIETGERRA